MLKGISIFSHKALSATLLLIGTGLSIGAIREVVAPPVILGIILWFAIPIVSLMLIAL